MTGAQQAVDSSSTTATTDGVPTDALQKVIERAEIEVGELAERSDASEDTVAEFRDAIETVKATISEDGESVDSSDESEQPELTVGTPTERGQLELTFNVYGVDLTDELFVGMFDVGGDCAGREYPRNGADHMAHEAANVVYHSLKDRFEWADEQVDGVAAGVEPHSVETEATSSGSGENTDTDNGLPIDPKRVPDRWEIVAGDPGYERNVALVWKREGALVPASVIEIRTADNRDYAKPINGFAVVVRDENADGVPDDGMINAQAEYDECDDFEAAVERLYDVAEEYPLPETRNDP